MVVRSPVPDPPWTPPSGRVPGMLPLRRRPELGGSGPEVPVAPSRRAGG